MKLISINIEGNRHLERIIPFIEKERPDVLCLQEVFKESLPHFETLGYTCRFEVMTRKFVDGTYADWGVAICTRTQDVDVVSSYYHLAHGGIQDFNPNDIVNSTSRVLLCATLANGESKFSIATTHFTWAPNGDEPSKEQIHDMNTLLSQTITMTPHVLCGDFNIPRGHNHLYEKLTAHYTDAIPASYGSSLDAKFHYVGSHPDKKHLFDSFMVDYIFSQPPYVAKDVRLEFGLSDHAAIVATITKEG